MRVHFGVVKALVTCHVAPLSVPHVTHVVERHEALRAQVLKHRAALLALVLHHEQQPALVVRDFHGAHEMEVLRDAQHLRFAVLVEHGLLDAARAVAPVVHLEVLAGRLAHRVLV